MVAMAAGSSLLLLLLLLVAPPFSSSAVVRPGRFNTKAVRSIINRSAKEFLKDRAQQGVTDFSGRRTNDDQLGSSAADTYGAFIFELSVGTSPQQIPVIMDITSELIWVQCGSCPATSCLRYTPLDTTTFMPDLSRYVGCDTQYCQMVVPGVQPKCNSQYPACRYELDFYAADAMKPTWYTSGYLANETFNFDTASVAGIVFGCSDDITLPDLAGSSGFLGFNRGALSLVTQLQITSFSYFIAPDDTGYNFVSWNWDEDVAPAAVGSRPKSQSTPLLAPTANQNPYYYVKLTGLLVDGKPLTSIPAGTFDAQADGSGGVYMSTTLPVTYLKEAAYNALRRELVSKIQSQGVIPVDTPGDLYHLCFLTQYFANAKVPTLALVFDGADATMELTVNNYFFDLPDGQTCMSILPSTDVSVLGSLLQAGKTMTYDIHGGQLMFQTAAGVPARPPVPLIATLLIAWGLGLQTLL
ncbi:aspartic proteinase nepenthesin-2-like [Lolium rigidum]|uniref:aspartic proteinase nepenthesin-2-like n=1 Tax=Lolium rigidum TaxID=89674 RepID=UPI001F5D34C9|nr:aspartic proteinase nepenthesin-2-like [Lolium rigidum]